MNGNRQKKPEDEKARKKTEKNGEKIRPKIKHASLKKLTEEIRKVRNESAHVNARQNATDDISEKLDDWLDRFKQIILETNSNLN